VEASDRSFTTLPPALEQSPEAKSPNPTTGPPLGNLTPPKGSHEWMPAIGDLFWIVA